MMKAAAVMFMMVIALRHGDDGVVSTFICDHSRQIYRRRRTQPNSTDDIEDDSTAIILLRYYLASTQNIIAFISDKSRTIVSKGIADINCLH